MFFIVVTHVISQEGTQEIQDSPPVLGDIWLQQLKNSTRSGSSLISRKGPRMWFVRFPIPVRDVKARRSSTRKVHPAQVIYTSICMN